MKLSKKKVLGLVLLVLFILGVDSPGKGTISKETFKGTWPFTIANGQIECYIPGGWSSRAEGSDMD